LKFPAVSSIDLTKANGTEAPPPRKTRLPGRISRGQSLATNGFTATILTNSRTDCAVYLQAFQTRSETSAHDANSIEAARQVGRGGIADL
jgi:hypothetical protein